MSSDSNILNKINNPKDLRTIDSKDLEQLTQEIRQFIIEIVATKEGHLGASLGVVELTIALHYVFDTPNDLLVWDVGHQAYVHKILTERKQIFDTNRQLNGISGFPKRDESLFDTFGVGHASTSISAALGMAIANKINNNQNQVIAVIGDASIAGGMAFEGLNHAGVSDTDLLVILNDNAIGIDPSVGALKSYLTNLKNGQQSSQNLFEALNFQYFGPIDGHDLPLLLKMLNVLKKVKGPKLLHVITTKGKGLQQAEQNQVLYHAPGKFDAKTGDILSNKHNIHTKFQDVFGATLHQLAQKDNKIVAITPAMPTGSSLNQLISEFPNRAFDVGIAEQHAVTFAAGLATQQLKVFCVIYSTFLQRAYDQVIHDVCLQNLPIIFCIDRAGLVGEDGATHHGVFDIAFLRCVPNLKILAPKDEIQLRQLLFTVSQSCDSPIAIRYPRGYGLHKLWKIPFETIDLNQIKCLHKGQNIAVLSTGFTAHLVQEAIEKLNNKNTVSLYHILSIKPLPVESLITIINNHQHIITIEDGVISGGFGDAVISLINDYSLYKKVIKLGVSDTFVEHGTINELRHFCKFDVENIITTIYKLIDE